MNEGGRAVTSDSLDVLVNFEGAYDADQDEYKTTDVHMWHKSTNLMVERRMKENLEEFEKSLLGERITKLNISSETVDPLNVRVHDFADNKERLGKTAGGFLPYMFIIFCFMGCMYPALDLVTGEKERGTIETLLTVPASRFNIMLGKVMTISMLIPLCIFFAGLLSAMVIKAKSFKEAQSIVSPFTFVIFLPAAMAMIPGIELDWKTALVPILNIALATKEIIAGTIDSGQYVAIVVSLIVLAIFAVILSYKQFSKESMVLK